MMAGMEQMMAAQRAVLETVQSIGVKSLEGTEKLVALNMQAARMAVEETTDNVRAMLDVREPSKLAETAMSMARPGGEKFASYAKHVYDITSETSGSIVEAMQRHVKDAQEQAADWFDTAAKTAPAGSEPLFAAARNAFSVARASYDQALSAGQKFAEFAEQGVAVATKTGAVRSKKAA